MSYAWAWKYQNFSDLEEDVLRFWYGTYIQLWL